MIEPRVGILLLLLWGGWSVNGCLLLLSLLFALLFEKHKVGVLCCCGNNKILKLGKLAACEKAVVLLRVGGCFKNKLLQLSKSTAAASFPVCG